MLLLFSDEVLLAHRSQETPFAINIELKLKGLLVRGSLLAPVSNAINWMSLLIYAVQVEDGDSYNVIGQRDDAFTLHLGKKSFVLASPAKDLWIEVRVDATLPRSKTLISN